MNKKFKILIPILILTLSACHFSENNKEESFFIKVSNFVESIGSNLLKKEKSDDMGQLYENVEKNKEKDEKINWIYNNFDNLSDVDKYLVGNDLDLSEFVYNFHNGIVDFETYPGQSVDFNRKTPFYLQWDNRWAYKNLGSSNIGYAGCGPTSMSMILNRLDPNLNLDPQILSMDAENYMTSDGVDWKFFTFASHKYGFNIENLACDESTMVDALENYPLLVSVNRGYFTLGGHILVIDSYRNGKFIINDPNSIKTSEKTWTFEQLRDQIVNIWLIY